jgi:hypothetical protein
MAEIDKNFNSRVTKWLINTTVFNFTAYSIIAAFTVYFCMYAFRRPYSVATYEGLSLWNIDYKTILIISQVLGYMTSKFIGIGFIASMPPNRRIMYLLLLIGFGWFWLFVFGLAPYPYGFICLFLNGLPLGLVWGLVFSFLEGRRVTEALAAGLSASFILSSGAVKAIGKWLIMHFNILETWMPFLTGLIFVIPLLGGIWLLSKIPPPIKSEESERNKREPMSRIDRFKMLHENWGLLLMMLMVYCFLQTYRDFRDNFAADIWIELGYAGSSRIFMLTEIPVAIVALILLGALFKIKDNKIAVVANHLIIATGIVLIWLATFLLKREIITPIIWTVLTGSGVYIAYVPFNSILFDRIIAVLQYKSNAGFLIYIADSIGYLGSVFVLFLKSFYASQVSAYKFMIDISIYIALIPALLILLSGWVFFSMKGKHNIPRSL